MKVRMHTKKKLGGQWSYWRKKLLLYIIYCVYELLVQRRHHILAKCIFERSIRAIWVLAPRNIT